MDKNKSRTDLLAAGRKKLQQFRQKKDNKSSGSQGKTKKSTKSEQQDLDSDTGSATANFESEPHVSEGVLVSQEVSDSLPIDSSMSNSTKNPAVTVTNPSALPAKQESDVVETAAVHVAELPLPEVRLKRDVDSTLQNTEVAITPIGSSAMIVSKEDNENVGSSVPVDLSIQPASVKAARGVALKVEVEGGNGSEDLLRSEEKVLPTSLMQVREEQEVDGSASKQPDGGGEIELEGDKQLPPPEPHDRAEIFSGINSTENSAKEMSSRLKQTGEADEASAFGGPAISDGEVCERLIETKMEISDGGSIVSPVAKVSARGLLQLTEVIRDLSEEEFRFVLESRQSGSDAQFETSGGESGFLDLLERLKEELIFTNFTKDIFHVQTAEQSEVQNKFDNQRMELVDEISHLHQSLSGVHERNQSLVEELSRCSSELQALSIVREELEKQLLTAKAEGHEHFTRANELENSLERSHDDLLRLSTELDNCKNLVADLQSENENLSGTITLENEHKKKQFEEKESYLHVNEKILAELVICKSELAVLEVENSDLIGNLSSVEERKKLEEKREHLRSESENLSGTITVENEHRKKLVEEKESYLHMNENILAELVGCKSLLGVLEVENSDLIGNLSSVMEERKKLEEEREHLQSENENLSGTITLENEYRKKLVDEKESYLHMNEKILAELVGCKSLLGVLEVENSDLIRNLSSVMEERKKLEEEREHLQSENENLSGTITLENEYRKKLVDEKESYLHMNENILAELVGCKSLLAVLEAENSDLIGNFSSLTEERKKLEEEREHLSILLAESNSLVGTLQVENANLNKSLALVTEERRKLEEEKEFLFYEKERLSAELLVLHCNLSTEHEERTRIDTDLKEALIHLEQLTVQNIFLNNSLDIHNAKIEEVGYQKTQIQFQADKDGAEKPESVGGGGGCMTEDEGPSSVHLEGWTRSKVLEREVFDDSLGFVGLKRDLEAADKIMEELVTAIEKSHSHTASFGRSGNKVAAPGVSKLIQAFESKVNSDEQEVEEAFLAANPSPMDPFMLLKELAENLKALIRQMGVEAQGTSLLFMGERDGRKIANAAFSKLKDQCEALEVHSNDLLTSNIELGVLCEAIKLHVDDAGSKISELEVLNESLRQQDLSLKMSNSELAERLCGYESRITDLQRQLYDLRQSSSETASLIYNQLDDSQNEAMGRISVLEQDWNACVAQIVESITKLDEFVDKFVTLTISISTHDGLDINSHITASVSNAIKAIEDMKEKVEAASSEHEAFSTLYKEMNEKYDYLHGRNELAVGLLHHIHGDLHKLLIAFCGSLGGIDMNTQSEELLDPLDYCNFETIIKQLEKFLGESLQLKSVNSKLESELLYRTKEFEDLSRRQIHSASIHNLIENVWNVLNLEGDCINFDEMSASHLESSISLLLQRYEEAEEQLSLSREDYNSKLVELTELQEKMHESNTLSLQHENEILILKESLCQTEEALITARSELKEKVDELEQSEQRISSIREKLSIAVAKGKGLVVQRDGLKQSLAETSGELERCLQEVQLKDARLHEVETKLKTYAEAGERVEALESELSYIRNSATAIRESFLLKDSVLQRIEEILEDLDLPEHFHSRDIIGKVDWLAKSVTGNSLPLTDWSPERSAAGDSYSDTSFVVRDAWKDDAQPDAYSGDDLRRKTVELENKFYMLAEQNEMLEQSLMERNNLVQRWEELLDRIDIPLHLRSLEPEGRIEWLGRSLSEAHHETNSLKQRINHFESYCGSLTADFDEFQRKVSDLEADLQAVSYERAQLSERLDILSCDNEKLLLKAVQNDVENEILRNEECNLQESLVGIKCEISRLGHLVTNVLQDPGIEDLVSGSSAIDRFEGLLMKLIENYRNLSSSKPLLRNATDLHDSEVAIVDGNRSLNALDATLDINVLKKELDDVLLELMHVRGERDKYMEMQQTSVLQVESLDKKREELQELLNQEEQKSASVREKLNVAVRRGKSLVQQRDGLKQTVEQMATELEHLKSEIILRDNSIANYEQQCRNLSTYPERVENLESENFLLRNHMTEMEHYLQEKGRNLSVILNALDAIDVDGAVHISDPVEKLIQIGKLCSDLRAAVVSSDEESKKSKRAAELLLAELNEVQERNDGFQEDLAKASCELAELTKERDAAEASKLEAFSRLEKLSSIAAEEKKIQFSQFSGLKNGLDQVRKAFQGINHLLADSLSRDLEFLHNLGANIESCLKPNYSNDQVGLLLFSSGGLKSKNADDKRNFRSMDWSDSNVHSHIDENITTEVYNFVGHHLKELIMEIGAVEEMLHKHSTSLQEQAGCLSQLTMMVHEEMNTQKGSVEALKRDVLRMESIEKDKELELDDLRRDVALLFEACTIAVTELDKRKAEVGKKNSADQPLFSGQTYLSSEEYAVQNMADRMLLTVRDFLALGAEVVDSSQKEMKTTIANLQKELHEKDIQKDRICTELVGQIKEAEAASKSYSSDLQSSTNRVHELEKVVEAMESDRNILHQRVKELQDEIATSKELDERVRSLTDVLAAKDQEIEALMQALDEEEVQMEDLTKKIAELEKVLKQKNAELEDLEASRGKIAKKLSVTVTKFDELHHLSGNLLTEVEKLQSQVLDRDAEISFLRQEVTRCTNDVLVASQRSNERNLDDILEFLTWFDTVIAQSGVHVMWHDNKENQDQNYKEVLQKKISSILAEVEDLRSVALRKDDMLQVERSKVEELTRRKETLEKSLHERESRLNLLEGVEDFEGPSSTTSEILEVEPLINKRVALTTSMKPQARSLRKSNNDQVAIAIDMDPDSSSRLEDEDDDKVHGFKSLTASRVVPKFTRPVTDMVDGLWVSCDRALMRQPVLRLGIIIYWALMHALLAAFVV